MPSKINKDLQEERDSVAFNVSELTNWYYGGAESVKEKRFLEGHFLCDPELKIDLDMSYLSHKEKYEEAVRRAVIIQRKIQKLQSEGRNYIELLEQLMGGLLSTSIFPEGDPLSLHFGMFLPALMNLSTPEQQAEWLPKAYNCSIIGTYAQTEMGHGTFIRGLETTATYDPNTKEFVINSPTITAYKWWPGGLGHTANHAVVFAQLFTNQKSHGLQPFIIQLRDTETHKPMPGITIGEIGNKLGFNTVNNGFLGFSNYRIPLNSMLMKNSKVLPDGTFVKGKHSILTYGTMTRIRVGIIKGQSLFLSKAVTIAMRYATVRRQSPIEPNKPEPKIIEHVTQQMKIFPAIAKVYVFKAASENLMNMYLEVTQELESGDLTRLPELHALSCCLKPVCTNEGTQAVEICRLACGGHGYLNSAGFNDIFKMTTAAQTYEGENTVLLLQTARFLTKSWGQVLKGQDLTPSVAYLKRSVERKIEYFDNSVNGILTALQSTAAGKIALAYKHIEERKKVIAVEEAVNQTGIELTKAAEIHGQVFLLESLIQMVQKATKEVSPALSQVFVDILELYSVDLAIRLIGEILQFVDITSADIEKLQGRLENVLKKIRVNAVGIVDGFDIPDLALGSVLGAYDGNVYERLLAAAKSSSLNQEDVNKSFELYLKPFMKSNL